MKTFMAAGQVSIFDDPLEAQFRRFHQTNPGVYTALLDLALQWRAAGHDKCSINMLFELLRWQYGMRTDGDQFDLNNNFRSRYARLLMANHRELDGFFNVRELRAA